MTLKSPSNTVRRGAGLVFRTLLWAVILALVGSAWLIWFCSEERQRVEALASIKARGGTYLWAGRPRASVPRGILREVFGYRSIDGIRLSDDMNDDELRRLERLFPEAELWERVGDKNQRIERGNGRRVADSP
jgi:hypothetical protein